MEFGDFTHGAAHTFGAGGEHEVRAEDAEETAAFNGHGLRHGEGELIAFRSTDEGESDAGVAGGGFEDMGFLVDFAGLFASFDHGDADAVFDGAEGVEEFALGQDDAAAGGHDAVDLDEGGVTHGLGDVGIDARHGILLGLGPKSGE